MYKQNICHCTSLLGTWRLEIFYFYFFKAMVNHHCNTRHTSVYWNTMSCWDRTSLRQSVWRGLLRGNSHIMSHHCHCALRFEFMPFWVRYRGFTVHSILPQAVFRVVGWENRKANRGVKGRAVRRAVCPPGQKLMFDPTLTGSHGVKFSHVKSPETPSWMKSFLVISSLMHHTYTR